MDHVSVGAAASTDSKFGRLPDPKKITLEGFLRNYRACWLSLHRNRALGTVQVEERSPSHFANLTWSSFLSC